jgi:hypothetical protein
MVELSFIIFGPTLDILNSARSMQTTLHPDNDGAMWTTKASNLSDEVNNHGHGHYRVGTPNESSFVRATLPSGFQLQQKFRFCHQVIKNHVILYRDTVRVLANQGAQLSILHRQCCNGN